MKNFFTNLGFGFLLFIIFLVISWIITVGIIKLIAFCFGVQISLLVATGIWLVMILISSIFKGSKQ